MGGPKDVWFIDALSEQRRRHIESHVRPLLDDAEVIDRWVRARNPHRRGEGFAYATERRLLIVLGGSEHTHAVDWDQIRAWGVDRTKSGGPVLGLRSDDEQIYIRLPVTTRASADAVRDFLALFAARADRAEAGLPPEGEIEATAHLDESIPVDRRSMAGMTRRVLVTLVGVVLVLGGIIVTPLPGPWSLPIVFGGLAVLSSEYDWAKDLLAWSKAKYRAAKQRFSARREGKRT